MNRPTLGPTLELMLIAMLFACGEDSKGPEGTFVLAADVPFVANEMAPFGPNGEPVQFGAGWGNMMEGAHGTFGIFPGGATSPPHTHSAAYHGIVLSGAMTNPFGTEADPVEMGPGSYWHVPAGEQHVTACVSSEPCIFYFHSESAFDFSPIEMLTNERSMQAVAMTAQEVGYVANEMAPFGPNGELVQFGAGHGDFTMGAHGTFGIFPGGAKSPGHTHSQDYYGVVISGSITNPFNGDSSPPAMASGSLWTVPANAEHVTACESSEDCRFYFHSRGAFDFTPLEE